MVVYLIGAGPGDADLITLKAFMSEKRPGSIIKHKTKSMN